MILPTKHISEEQALVGIGGILLRTLRTPTTVTNLWEAVRENDAIGTFERFVLALDLLFIVGVVGFADGMIVRDGA